MKKKTSNILKFIGVAVAAGLSMYGTRKANEKLCKMENEKTRIKEITEIGHLNDLQIEPVKIENKSGILISSDDSVLLFLDKIDNHKETNIEIEKFLLGRGIKKDAFKGIIASSYSKVVNDIYMEENPDLINMDEASILYNKPVFLPSDSNSVDFGIPIKVGRSIMISAGMASTGPIALPAGIGGRFVKQGLLLNLRDKGLILITADTGKNLITTMQQISAFGNIFHSVILLDDECGNLRFACKFVKKSAALWNSICQKLIQKLSRTDMYESSEEKNEILEDLISHGIVLCGNHGSKTTMEYMELFGENLKVVKFNKKLVI